MSTSAETALSKLAQDIRACRLCAGLNAAGVTESAPGYGAHASPVAIIGQSLCRPCMSTQVPFTGGSGRLLDQAFSLAQEVKEGVFITNVVHCHTPDNRPSRPYEIHNCADFLRRELEIVKPLLIVGLGKDAREWLVRWAGPEHTKWSQQLVITALKGPALLFLMHPAYMMRQPAAARLSYAGLLADALRWARNQPARTERRA